MLTYWSNINFTHGCRVDGDTGDTEKVPSTDSLQVRRVKQSLAQLVLLNSEVDVVAVGKLIESRRDTRAILNPEK